MLLTPAASGAKKNVKKKINQDAFLRDLEEARFQAKVQGTNQPILNVYAQYGIDGFTTVYNAKTGKYEGGYDPKSSTALQEANRAKVAQQVAKARAAANGGGGGSGTSPASNKNALKKVTSKDPIKWNPPAHQYTMVPRISYQDQNIGTSNTALKNFQNARLGQIYTDTLHNAAYNATGSKQRYGFRFHYNPGSLTYQAVSDENISVIDRMSDPGQLLIPGTVTINMELYLNRIYDFASPSTSLYHPHVDNKALDNILQHGTEWDLEYLFRVTQGGPTNDTRGIGKTANYGIISPSIIRMKLGKGFNYLGRIDGISVNHILFTRDMIPTFTVVQLSITRQITLGKNAEATADWVNENMNSDDDGGSSGSNNSGSVVVPRGAVDPRTL